MLSIAICTHNRASELRVLLLNLQALGLDERTDIEIVVVDNASSDQTQSILREFSRTLAVRSVIENRLGLSHARNRAIRECRSDIIWFLDDDTLVSEQCLNAFQNAVHDHPSKTYFGGPISVDWQGQRPTWLKSDDLPLLNGLFGNYTLGPVDIEYSENDRPPYGANFIVRRTLIDEVGEFDSELGLKGSAIGRGEEVDLFRRARQLGFLGLYVAEARIGHRFQHKRLSLGYLWRYGFAKGREEVIANDRTSDSWLMTAGEQFYRGILQLLKGRRDRFYQCWINVGIARGRYLASHERSGDIR